MEELVFLNALYRILFESPGRLEALLAHFGSAREAWRATEAALAGVPKFTGDPGRLAQARRQVDPEKEWRRLEELSVGVLTPQSRDYPPLLKEIDSPPPLLYYRGAWHAADNVAIAVVGSRRATYYGREVAARLAGELAGAGVTVVSGLALGVDTSAHRGALKAGGRTIAVLGCGLDSCYPPRNASLLEEIVTGGVVVSEFPLDAVPLPHHFPRRNRIISGLALGTVVVEAAEKSGALVTARLALEQNREVFAVPGNVGSPYSRGCHRLLKEGAKLVESIQDIIDELPLSWQPAAPGDDSVRQADELPAEEERLLGLIPYRPIHVDEIVRLSGQDAATVFPRLLQLELRGLLRRLPGKYYSR